MKFDIDTLNLIAKRLGYISMRMESLEDLGRPALRADDWDSSKHPRGPDGKFISMGGGGGSAKLHSALNTFVSGLKGKKGSTAGLIKHLLQAEVPENEIFAAAKHMYGLTDDKKGYIKWYHNDMKKSGVAVPDIVKGGDHLSELDTKTSTAEPAAEPKTETKGPVAGEKSALPTHIDELTWTGGKLGSNDGAQYVDANGQKYYVKFQKSAEHAANEVLASKLYQAAGAPVADVGMITTANGKPATVSRWLDGGKPGANPEKFDPNSPEHLASVQKNFGTHAWLGNWDAIGLTHDNQVKPPGSDEHYTVDVGGAMKFRAQGAPKKFGPEAVEFDTMRDPKEAPQAGPIYSKMTDDAILASVTNGPAAISPEDIAKLVNEHGHGTAEQKAELAKLLTQRRQDIIDKAMKAGGKSVEAKTPGKSTEAPLEEMPAPDLAPASEELPAESAPSMLPEPSNGPQKSVKAILENALNSKPGSPFDAAEFVKDYGNYTMKNAEDQAYLDKAVEIAKAEAAKAKASTPEPAAETAPDMLPEPTNLNESWIKEDLKYTLGVAEKEGDLHSLQVLADQWKQQIAANPDHDLVPFKKKALEIAEKKLAEGKPEEPVSSGVPKPSDGNAAQASLFEMFSNPEINDETKVSALSHIAAYSEVPDETKAYAKKLLDHMGAASIVSAPATEEPGSFLVMPTTNAQEEIHDVVNNDKLSPAEKVEAIKQIQATGVLGSDDEDYAAQAKKHLGVEEDKSKSSAAPTQTASSAETPEAKAWKPEDQHTYDVDALVDNKMTSTENKLQQLKKLATFGLTAQQEYAAQKMAELGQPFEPPPLVSEKAPLLGMKISEPTTPAGVNIKSMMASPHSTLEAKMKWTQGVINNESNFYSPATVAYAKEAMAELAKVQGTSASKPIAGAFKGTSKFKETVEVLSHQFDVATSPHTKNALLSKVYLMAQKGTNEGNKKFAQAMFEHMMKGGKKYEPGSAPAPKPQAPAAPATPKSTPAQPQHALSEGEKTEYAALKQNWQQVLEANKPPIDSLTSALDAAMLKPTVEEQKTAVAAISEILNPKGMGQTSANTFLNKVKSAYGVAAGQSVSQATSSLPTGASKLKQDAVYEKALKAPKKYTETIHHLEDASGVEVKARLVANTKNIPGDWYAKVTSAYGNSKNAMTQAVDKAMSDYANIAKGVRTGAENSSLAAYRDGQYDDINLALLGKYKMTPSAQAHINNINSAISKNYVPADTPVWRGLKCSLKELTGFDDPQEAVGRCFEHKNFASVSRSQQTAKNFGEKVMLNFTVPAGTNAAVMGGQATGDTGHFEREMVLSARSMFQVDKVEQKVVNGVTKHIVHCTYLGVRES